MKILKILLILLVPAIGIVGCQKSNVTPGCDKHTEGTVVVPDDSENTGKVSSRPAEPVLNEDKTTTIVGSGDDDRDGGDKPKKTGR